ncbi:MAG: helix-turn-helix transcriptional regulator [Chloroflexi bacterium]|nr:helix-turn-helix transcriptional regulator [Chloroflexota bacterium]
MKRRQPSSRVKLRPDRVWELLNRLNMTQNELACLAGISSGYLSQLMSGTRCPSAEVRRKLMEVLRITSFDDLFILEVVS